MTPYYETDGNRIYMGDALNVLKSLPSESAHCCVTSPPYWGLRNYDVEGQIGLEETPEEYIEKMVIIFREVRRVLRSDGSCWLNLGDSYSSNTKGDNRTPEQLVINSTLGPKRDGLSADNACRKSVIHGTRKVNPGLKPKDLCGIPWRTALALQADGWWLRSDIIWHKPNPMPESVTDRPTKAHEYIFLLTKSAKYFYDAEAVKEPANDWGTRDRTGQVAFTNGVMPNGQPHSVCKDINFAERGRNKRTVWTIATQPFSGSHFAVFPEKLIEPCILAGTSEKGCCVECGSPVERVIDYKANYKKREVAHAPNNCPTKVDSTGWEPPTITTTGWQPTCKCNTDTTPCTVLDPFFGSGTSGIVAHKHGRKFIGIELSQKYLDEIAIPRIEKATKQLKLW